VDPATSAAAAHSTVWPFAILGLCVALLVLLIAVLRLHAFLALVLAAVAAGVLAPVGSLPGEPGRSHLVQAVELTAKELGNTAGNIGLVIALAAIIGMCLMESGAADKVVRRFLAVFGEKRAGLALLLSSYVLSIPIFFDTFFMLVLPIARALALRTRRNYVVYVMAICAAAATTHGLVIPHPGPIAMAEILHVDTGQAIIAALLVGLFPLAASWLFIGWLGRRVRIEPMAAAGDVASLERSEDELPPFAFSILPVILPTALISAASIVAAMKGFGPAHPSLWRGIEFLGNRHVALFIGVVLAAAVLVRGRRLKISSLGPMMGPPLEMAGVIILISSAGGAFGAMLRNAGVGEAIRATAEGRHVNLVLLAWGVAAVIRVAQGSTTVALLTTAAMVQPLLSGGSLPCHPVYVLLAIGFGGLVFSWMNDSGFWVVGRLSGFSERETLQTWTATITVVSVSGLLACLVLSKLLPFV
jgi:gluconate:H+ symporter, GntP family